MMDHAGNNPNLQMEHGKHATDVKKLAVVATLHCLLGCSIGEILGMVIGTHFGLHDAAMITLAIFLAFIFGYTFAMIPLLRHMSFRKALPKALAADTISITTMEIVDNLIIIFIPGALAAGLFTWLFWGSLIFSLIVAFFITVPVNYYLIKSGKGHALVHNDH